MGRGEMGGSPPGGSGGGRGEWAAEEVAEWTVDRKCLNSSSCGRLYSSVGRQLTKGPAYKQLGSNKISN